MEELRLQLGDRLPIAVSLMAKSMGITTAELAKQMELGKVYSKDVLPNFGRALKEWARNNGALDKSLNNLRVQQARMITQTQLSGDIIFQSGWGEGLSDLYKTITEELKELEPLMKSIGRIGGSVFRLLAKVVGSLGSILKAVGKLLDWVTDKTGDWSAALLVIPTLFSAIASTRVIAMMTTMGGKAALLAKALNLIPSPLKYIGTMMGWLARKIALPLILLEEFANFITGGKKGVFNPSGISLKDRLSGKGKTPEQEAEELNGVITGPVIQAAQGAVEITHPELFGKRRYQAIGDAILNTRTRFVKNLGIDKLLENAGIPFDSKFYDTKSQTPFDPFTIFKTKTPALPNIPHLQQSATINIKIDASGYGADEVAGKIKQEVSDTMQGYFVSASN